MKIGFFEKWNDKAQMIEKSSLNLQMIMALIGAFIIILIGCFFQIKISEVTFNMLVLALLIYSVTPKSLAKYLNKE